MILHDAAVRRRLVSAEELRMITDIM